MNVLLAEGVPDERRRLKKAIESSGHRVIAVPDGDSALRAFEAKGPFDYALLDLTMPGTDGLQFLEQVGRDGGLREVNCLIMAGHLSWNIHEQVRALGGNIDVLQKPLDLGMVVARLRPGGFWAFGQSSR